MELIELNRIIEETRTRKANSKTQQEYNKYTATLQELQQEKRELLAKEFKRC